MFYWCFTALPKALWQLGKTLEKPAKNKKLWKNLGKLKKNLKRPAKNKTTLEKPGKTKKTWKHLGTTCKNLGKTWENQNIGTTKKRKNKKRQTKKNKKQQKKNNISRLFGGGGSQPRLSENCFFLVFPMFFLFWSLSAICTFLYTGRSVSSCVQACRNQSFNHCSYEHTGSEDQECVFQFWNVRPCPR